MTIHADQIPGIKEMLELKAHGVPVGWESVPGMFTNYGEAGPEAREVILQGLSQIVEVWSSGEVKSKADNKVTHPFGMEPKFALSRHLQEQGWVQWHTSVQRISKEECAELGVKYKRHRYAVHVWMGPTGTPILAKVKLQGKVPLDA